MSHKADKSFFDEKKEWSRRKDRILGSYLHAYLPKIATQKRPILIVDAFAGPGRFGNAEDEGEDGSPILIAKQIQEAAGRASFTSAMLICIERDTELYQRLCEEMQPYAFARCRLGTFLDHLEEVESIAESHSTFLYVDPFTVEGIDWNIMSSVLSRLCAVQSVEVLLNFNAASFVRRALAALQRNVPEEEDVEDLDAPFTQPASVERLNQIVGGDWWISVVDAHSDFPSQVAAIAGAMEREFRKHFREVGMHAIKARPHHTVPKYSLVFGTRSAHGLRLMNDEMAKSRKSLASLAESGGATLFEMRSEELVPDVGRLPEIISRYAASRRPRQEVIDDVIREAFCEFTRVEIRGAIEQMLKSGELKSETGKTRINDKTLIWQTQ